MERNREARRAGMVPTSNCLPRRRHRPNSLRDSPDEEGAVEFSESARLRERVKKDRDRDRERNRERDREREIERSSRSKRRRGDRLIQGGDRAEDSSQESNDDDDYEEDEGNHQHQSNGGAARSVPQIPYAASASFPNHHHPSSSSNHHHHQQNHLHHHKTIPPSSTNVLRTSPVWKSGDEVICISVPRKARSAHTKRAHDWVSCTGGAAPNSGGGGRDQNLRQASTSPMGQSLVSNALSPQPPLSPTSSNVSGRKKIKANGSKQRPPKTSSKSTSSNREELEIEIAEVLYGLMTQSQAPSKKEVVANDSTEVNNRSSGDAMSSAVSNSQSPAILPTNTNSCLAPFQTTAPKRKRPRQVSENQSSPSIRSSPSASAKPPNDQTLTLKTEASSPNSEKMPLENGGSLHALQSPLNSQGKTMPTDHAPEPVVDSEINQAVYEPSPREDHEAAIKEEASLLKKDSAAVALENSNCEDSTAVATATTYEPSAVSEVENHTEKIQIDLMAPPPQLRSSPEGEGKVNFCSTVEDKRYLSNPINELRLDDGKLGKFDQPNLEAEEKKASTVVETEPNKTIEVKGHGIDLQLDLEKLDRDTDKKSLPMAAKTSKEQQSVAMEKTVLGQSSSLALPMSMASWSCGLPPLGYMPPLQGVLTMDGSSIPPAPLQPVFSQPRPKRCATHCYIARNIHMLQQFMKMNPFWPPAATPAPLCNLSVVPATEFNGRGGGSGLEKGHGLAIFPGLGSKEKSSSQAANIPDPVQRNQQILLQQPLPPPVAPNSLLPGHTYIIPLSQQQAAALPAKTSSATGGRSLVTSNVPISGVGGSSSATVTGGNHAAAAAGFSYPNVPPSETPYLAILQNNAYFQIPAVGAPLNYRGAHPHQLPLFNGSFYTPQMIHPSQLQQQPTSSQQSKPIQQSQQNTSLSSGSSSSHKHLQNKRPQAHGTSGNGSPSPLPFPASKSHTIQPQQHLQNELCGEDSPSTAESRARAPVNVYNQNYLMQIHHSNFGVMASSASMGGGSSAPTTSTGNHSVKKQQQSALKTGLESMLHQHFAMPFASAPGNDISSSVVQNRAMFQTQQKKSYGEDSRGGSGDLVPTGAEEMKVSSSSSGKAAAPSASLRQSSELPSGPATSNVIDGSRSMSLGSGPAWNTHPAVPSSKAQLHAQYQHQMMQQLQQQFGRSKPSPATNGTVPPEYLTSSAAPVGGGAMFPTTLSAFPQNLVQISSNCSSPSRSPQWKSSAARASSTSQAQPSSSVKTHPQQQQMRAQQNHTQISFGANNHKSTTSQSQSSTMMAGSPTTSSISKGAAASGGGSPRTTTSASMSNKQADQTPSQQAKMVNQKSSPASGRTVPSILGSQHIPSSTSGGGGSNNNNKPKGAHQSQLFFSGPYAQAQSPSPNTSSASATSGYFVQRRRPEQQQAQHPPSSSSGMLTMCPVSKPTSASANMRATSLPPSQNIPQFSSSQSPGNHQHHLLPAGFSYVQQHPSPVKPTEQKQPAA